MTTIREITELDVPALFRVRVQVLENEITLDRLAELGITEDSIREAIRGSQKGWLCEVDGEVCGFAMGDCYASELTVIALLPRFEGRGIGGDLLRKVEDWLGSRGCKRLWLTTDIDTTLRAYGFYRHHGWEDWKVEDGERYMAKRLIG